MLKVDEKSQKMNKDEAATEDANQPKSATVQKERSNDVRMELEKSDRDRDSGSGNMVGKRHQPQQSNSDKPSMFNFYPLLSMCVYLSTWVVYARFFFFRFLQFNPALCLCRSLFLAGQAAFLLWGTLGIMLISSFVVKACC